MGAHGIAGSALAVPSERRDAGAPPAFATPGRQDVLEATRALAALLGARVPLARALSIAASMVPPGMGAVLEDVRLRIAAGSALAPALGAHPRAFSRLYLGVARSGERSGDLRAAFAALTRQLEAEARLRARLQAATVYPLVLAAAGIVTVAVLVRFVLPRFAELLTGASASLPWSTGILLATSAWAGRAWPWLAGAVVFGVAAVPVALRREGGRRWIAALSVSLPLVGTLRRTILAARFARLLGVLLGSGAPLLTALDDAADSVVDPLARDEISRVRAAVREGSSLHAAIAGGTLFPPMLARLVAVGEESGRLREFLDHAAELCEERTERMLLRLVTLLEPAMIALFGLIIAFVALSLLQAIYGVDATTFR